MAPYLLTRTFVRGNLPFVTTYHDVLEVLGEPTRRAIVERLGAGPCAVVELARALPVSRPAISQHLKVLGAAGLVAHHAEGNRHVYRLRPEGVRPLRAWLDEFWEAPLTSFRDYVAREAPGAAAAGTPTGTDASATVTDAGTGEGS